MMDRRDADPLDVFEEERLMYEEMGQLDSEDVLVLVGVVAAVLGALVLGFVAGRLTA